MPFNVQCKKCLHYRDEWCAEKLYSPDPEMVRDCLYYSTASNADRIRAMTDEELAEFITPVKCVDCHLLDCGIGEIGNNKSCTERILDWLKQEANE